MTDNERELIQMIRESSDPSAMFEFILKTLMEFLQDEQKMEAKA